MSSHDIQATGSHRETTYSFDVIGLYSIRLVRKQSIVLSILFVAID